LADPDLARNFGKLLQTYREAPPEKREQALLAAMREIKSAASNQPASDKPASAKSAMATAKSDPMPPVPAPTRISPPFEPDLFSPNWSDDRRRYRRVKCFVAVELRVDGADAPIWGNLSNTSLGGCQVETAGTISEGAKVEIGLWVASGKIWVKGLALNGVVTRGASAGRVRLRFEMDHSERENLKQFLKYVQETTRASSNESSYLQLLK
jgi:hypothetical protein